MEKVKLPEVETRVHSTPEATLPRVLTNLESMMVPSVVLVLEETLMVAV
jgi:hypothetical protein